VCVGEDNRIQLPDSFSQDLQAELRGSINYEFHGLGRHVN
jgi:hypothetical protein